MMRYIPIFMVLLLMTISAEAARVPLAGTYTVGGVSPDYATLNAAVNDLNTLGISAPVTFSIIKTGTFNEQVTITDFTRTGNADDVVLFRSSFFDDQATLTYSGVSSNLTDFVVKVDGASHVTFRNLNFEAHSTATASGYGTLINLAGNASNILIENSTLTGDLAGDEPLIEQSSDGSHDNLTIRNNEFIHGSWGVALDRGGTSNVKPTVTDNTFSGQTDGGIDLRSVRAVVDGNTVYDASTWSDSFFNGIIIEDGQATITNNYVDLAKGHTGIWYFGNGIAAASTVANNMIAVRGSTSSRALFVADDNVTVYHNTLFSNQSQALALVVSNGAEQVELKNNLLINVDGGKVLDADSASITQSNYNNLYTTGATLVNWDNVDYGTLFNYQTVSGQDSASVSTNVDFVDVSGLTDLHLQASSASDPDLAAPAIGTVTTDIDGDTRSSYNATMGADEGDEILPLDNADAGGFYTVGGTSPDFVNPATAIDTLNRLGAKGAVTFKVRSGLYLVSEVIDFPQYDVTRSDGGYTLTIEADDVANVPTLYFPSSTANDNYILKLAGSNHVHLRNLRLSATGVGQFGRTLHLANRASDNLIENVQFFGVDGQTSNTAALIYTYTDDLQLGETEKQANNQFIGNTFNDGSYAIYSSGPLFGGNGENTVISGNTFNEQTAFAIYSDHDDITVANNVFENNVADVTAVHLENGNGATVTGNVLSMRGANSVGMLLENSRGNSFANPSLLANNIVVAWEAVRFESNSTTWDIYHNTLRGRTMVLYINPNTIPAVTVQYNIVNNILHIAFNGFALSIEDATAVETVNHNNIYRTGVGTLVHYNGADYNTLADYQGASGLDADSVSVTVSFVDNTNDDLHLTGASDGDMMLGGTPLVTVLTDIDGETRSTSLPYMGADEATPLTPPTAVNLATISTSTQLPYWMVTLLGLFITLLLWTNRHQRI